VRTAGTDGQEGTEKGERGKRRSNDDGRGEVLKGGAVFFKEIDGPEKE